MSEGGVIFKARPSFFSISTILLASLVASCFALSAGLDMKEHDFVLYGNIYVPNNSSQVAYKWTSMKLSIFIQTEVWSKSFAPWTTFDTAYAFHKVVMSAGGTAGEASLHLLTSSGEPGKLLMRKVFAVLPGVMKLDFDLSRESKPMSTLPSKADWLQNSDPGLLSQPGKDAEKALVLVPVGQMGWPASICRATEYYSSRCKLTEGPGSTCYSNGTMCRLPKLHTKAEDLCQPISSRSSVIHVGLAITDNFLHLPFFADTVLLGLAMLMVGACVLKIVLNSRLTMAEEHLQLLFKTGSLGEEDGNEPVLEGAWKLHAFQPSPGGNLYVQTGSTRSYEDFTAKGHSSQGRAWNEARCQLLLQSQLPMQPAACFYYRCSSQNSRLFSTSAEGRWDRDISGSGRLLRLL